MIINENKKERKRRATERRGKRRTIESRQKKKKLTIDNKTKQIPKEENDPKWHLLREEKVALDHEGTEHCEGEGVEGHLSQPAASHTPLPHPHHRQEHRTHHERHHHHHQPHLMER